MTVKLSQLTLFSISSSYAIRCEGRRFHPGQIFMCRTLVFVLFMDVHIYLRIYLELQVSMKVHQSVIPLLQALLTSGSDDRMRKCPRYLKNTIIRSHYKSRAYPN